MAKHKCPVCGQYEFPCEDSFDVCEICGWEDDGLQEDDPDYDGGANPLSLNQFKKEWKIENTHKQYISLMEKRFSAIKDENYQSWVEYSVLVCGPEQYENEAEMLEFLRENPDATLRETVLYFDEITPDGVGPGIDEAELLEDDENE